MALERAGRKQRDLEKDLGEDLKAVEFQLLSCQNVMRGRRKDEETIGPRWRFAERNSGEQDRD